MAAPDPGFNLHGSSSGAAPAASASATSAQKKKKRSSKAKKRRSRRKSFVITNDDMDREEGMSSTMAAPSQSFYNQRNLSGTSIDSETLLDHRYVFGTL